MYLNPHFYSNIQKIHQRTFFKVFPKVFYFSFDIFISMYRMNILSLPMNKSMLGHHFQYPEQCVATISHRSAAIWSKSFDSKPFEMRKSKFWRIPEILLLCSFDSKFTRNSLWVTVDDRYVSLLLFIMFYYCNYSSVKKWSYTKHETGNIKGKIRYF